MTRVKRIIKPSIFLCAVASVFWFGYQNLEYNWQWYRLTPFLYTVEDGGLVPGLLIRGLLVTLKISAISLCLAVVIGFFSAFARLSPVISLRAVSWIYVETIRNTPLLIQIFVIYFVISPVFEISAVASAVTALSLFEGAYASEIVRSGIINIDRGQIEAAKSIGLSTSQTYIKIIIPQMLRSTLPMLAGQSVSLIKDSALVSTISIYDLTMQGQRIVSETFLTFEVWFLVAFCYLLITGTISMVIRLFENRLKKSQ